MQNVQFVFTEKRVWQGGASFGGHNREVMRKFCRHAEDHRKRWVREGTRRKRHTAQTRSRPQTLGPRIELRPFFF